MIRLFVYGTLKPGHSLSGMLEQEVISTFPASTTGAMYHVNIGSDEHPVYPVVDFDAEGAVYGDVLIVDPESYAFEYVDKMEVGAGYERKIVTVIDDNGDDYQCLAYDYKRPHGAQIVSGVWA